MSFQMKLIMEYFSLCFGTILVNNNWKINTEEDEDEVVHTNNENINESFDGRKLYFEKNLFLSNL